MKKAMVETDADEGGRTGESDPDEGGTVGRQPPPQRIPKPKAGSALYNKGGSGTKGGGIPQRRVPNKKQTGAKMQTSPGQETPDSGSIRKSKDYKSLMNTLSGKGGKKPQ
jgi:hypothetical protein